MHARIAILLLAVFLSVFMLETVSAADTMMTTEQKEETYSRVFRELEAYLDSEGASSDLNGIIEAFDDLGSYRYSRMLQYYVQILQKAVEGNFDWELTLRLEMLEANADFQAYLEQRRQDGTTSIGTVAQLKAYVLGREAEREGRTEDALGAYRECLSFFDAAARYESLRNSQSTAAYELAVTCLKSEDFARAWFILKDISPYRDSAELMKGIESVLGYQPAGPEDNPRPVNAVRITGTGRSEISLSWDPAVHTEFYEVAWRQSGTDRWTAAQTVSGTSVKISGLKTDTEYDFSITAVSGQVKAKSTVIMNRKTAVVPQPVTGFHAKDIGQTEITLAWNRAADAEKYEVSYRTSGKGHWTVIRTTAGTALTVTGLKPDTAYDFSVAAITKTERGERRVLASVTRAKPRPEVDNIITFGHYEQDGDTANGKEPIEWIVLDVQGNKALLLSRYGLDSKPYNTVYTGITWEKCTLRSWLNGEFLKKAFLAQEQAGILLTNVDNNQGYFYTDGGPNTEDKIFLLSYAEANYYLKMTWKDHNNKKSRVSPTAYAKKNGAYTDSKYKTAEGTEAGRWWLRSPDSEQDKAITVDMDGSVYSRSLVNYSYVIVRPALWVNLESDIF